VRRCKLYILEKGTGDFVPPPVYDQALEPRLARWLLQTHDCIDDDAMPLTQEFLGQMLGVRRTSMTIAVRLLQGRHMIRYRRGSAGARRDRL
jgi:hypothetical protein